MTTYRVGYFVGSLASDSINRKLAAALVRLAPSNLEFTEISIKDLPHYSRDYDDDYPVEARALKETITSVDVPGTPFPVKLVNNIVVQGKVVLPAGTHLSGKVITSRRLHHSNDKLTVDLTGLQSNGRTIPIKAE